MAAASNGSEYFEFETEVVGETSFHRPSNAESVQLDEEELMWEAISRLPSVKRGNFAILKRTPSERRGGENGGSESETIDVTKLDRTRRELLVKKALATNDQDNFRLLSAIKQRLDRVGLKVPKIEVRFQNINVEADAQIGSRALPTLINVTRDFFEKIAKSLRILRPNKFRLKILKSISGVIKPGRMTLLLGPPGSGKSTLLLALSGKLVDKTLKTSGEITYNGTKLDQFYVRRTSAYISQTDNHIAELTVRETLDFAARCQGAGEGLADYMKDLADLEKERNIRPVPEIDAFMKASSVGGTKHKINTDYVLKVLGLDVCSDTMVGNDMLRGVSGGQRKRVTTEMANAFTNSRFGRSLESTLSVPYEKSQSHHPLALSKTKFAASKWELVKTCFAREKLLMSRHGFLYIFRTCQVAFVGFVTSTIFLRTRLHPVDEVNGNLYLSCLFFGAIHMMFNGFSELPLQIFRLPIFYKQRDNLFHPAWVWSVVSWILRVPYSMVESIVWSCVVYYTVGFAPAVGRFFRFMFLKFAIHQMAIALFRMLASVARDMVIASTFGSAALLVVSAIGNNTVGYNVLHSHGLPFEGSWYWGGVGVLVLYAVVFNIIVTLALAYLNPLKKAQAVFPSDDSEETPARRDG
ncbi:ABC transporter-like protein [Corchorus olitorius]|uniref:ABC transporter-like protein n=1 Tax=Corchorus olitorius TaxID=93759 RepID=A0A1R3J6J0_9ROSI|nr:ABC transporter-like protein [Corchorus olitorius]